MLCVIVFVDMYSECEISLILTTLSTSARRTCTIYAKAFGNFSDKIVLNFFSTRWQGSTFVKALLFLNVDFEC